MTETEWLTCADPRPMLEYLRDCASPRKLRWFACACVRTVWEHLADERGRVAVEVAERFADGDAKPAELARAEIAAFESAQAADLKTTVSQPVWSALRAAARAASADAYGAATGTAFIVVLCVAPWEFDSAGGVANHGDPSLKVLARQHQSDLLRELFGNPFRPVVLSPDWLQRNEGAVLRLATEIYQRGQFDDLPILGDALEDAGCTDESILTHCHQSNGHVRGCWVVDLLKAEGRRKKAE